MRIDFIDRMLTSRSTRVVNLRIGNSISNDYPDALSRYPLFANLPDYPLYHFQSTLAPSIANNPLLNLFKPDGRRLDLESDFDSTKLYRLRNYYSLYISPGLISEE